MLEQRARARAQARVAVGHQTLQRLQRLDRHAAVGVSELRLEPAEAVARPRMAILPDGVTVAMEADFPNAAQLSRSDRHVRLMPARHPSFGHAHALVIDGPGKWRAGADPRSDGSVEYVN